MAESYSIQAVLSAVDKNFSSTMKDAAGASDDLDNGVQKSNTSIMDIAKGVGVFRLLEVGMNAVTSSVGAAVSRFDTLNQYPKVLESLGASAEDSDRGIQILSDGIDGLPTKLDDVAATSQQMFLVFRDADKASESTIALNNALLASGSSGDKAARGTEAYLKMLRSGKVDMDTWMSLQDTMGIGLDKVAKEMLGAEASTTDLYKALQSGEISIDSFNGALVGMSDELGELAKTNTQGIATSFSNMSNAVSKGVANIIKTLDNLVRNTGINADGIAGIFDVLKVKINDSFTFINKSIDSSTPYIVGFMKVTSQLTPVVNTLTPVLVAAGSAFLYFKIVQTVTPMINALNTSVKTSTAIFKNYEAAIKMGTGATKAYQIAVVGGNASVKISSILFGALTGKIKATTAASTASKGLLAALGPVGIALAVVSAAAFVLTKNYKQNTAETKALAEGQKEIKTSLEQSAKSQDDNAIKLKKQADNTTKLKDEIYKLSAEEYKTAEQKELLSQKIEQLNGQVDGLSLAYDEETNSLNLSNEQAQKRLDLQAKIQAGASAEESLLELQKQKVEITKAEKEAEDVMNSAREKTSNWLLANFSDLKNAKNAEEAYSTAKENSVEIDKQLSEAKAAIDEAEKARLEQLKQSRNEMVNQGKVDYQELSDAQKTSFDSMQSQYDSLLEKTTNVFEQVEQKQTISLDKMIENLKKNEEAMSKWSENVKILSERGVDEGIIAQLEKMGPAGATQAERLVKETSDELGNLTPEGKAKIDEFNNAMTNGMAETTHGMSKLAGEGSEPIVAEFEKTGKKSMQSLKGQFEGSELQQLGKDVNAGIAKGLGVNVNEVEEAAKNSANKLDESYKHALGIHSPSRVMIENGGFTIAGLVQGIQNNQNKAESSMTSLATALVNSLDSLPNQFENIGYNAMIGLNNGLVSARGSVMNTANSIANDVANTMRKALDIHSPSRVMQAIGNFVGEGLAIGMEDSTKLVGRASESLAQASMVSPSSFASDSIDGRGLTLNLDLTLQMLNKDFRAIVEGITEMQNTNMRLESGF
ncbi:tape measure protein [Lactococcus garvieae]|uniref:tape measure protein n=1 Tax=Lactococcus garvieae TaxID=1363 RepID=UPI00371BEBCF